MSLSINEKECFSLHFVGILGSGMSSVATFCSQTGLSVSGSDRLLESEDTRDIKNKLEKMGCLLFPQDGSGISSSTSAIVVSTAIEESNADIKAARSLGLMVFHRSDVLAALVKTMRTVAIAGTSGKSSVTAMVFELLTACKKSPSLITGAALIRLEESGAIGNAFKGDSDILIIEADESDGSLVKYHPYISVFLNISKDHKPEEEVLGLFATLAGQSSYSIANADDPQLLLPGISSTFGVTEKASYKPDAILTTTPTVSFLRDKILYELPHPGHHNLLNILAALSVCEYLGCSATQLAKAVQQFKGVKRRFSITHLTNKITVIDDFAHNPEKVKAAISTAKALCGRVLAVFQPHGFGPTRFLKNDFIKSFSAVLTGDDRLYLLPIYYAGGTANKDISSNDLAIGIAANSKTVCTPSDRNSCIKSLKEMTIPGDAVLIMGARDPSLSSFVLDVIGALEDHSNK